MLIDAAFCCLEQYLGCAALRSFLSICWQVLPVATAYWWNASSLLRAVKHPYVPRPFHFIISVSVMWLVCTIATLISHTHIHTEHGIDNAAGAEMEKSFAVFCYLHVCMRPVGWMGGGDVMWPCRGISTELDNTVRTGTRLCQDTSLSCKMKAVCSSTALKWSDEHFLVFLSSFLCF